MGNKSSASYGHPLKQKPPSPQPPAPDLDPLEVSLTSIISRPTKVNDIRYEDLDRSSHRVSIYDKDTLIVDKGYHIEDEKVSELSVDQRASEAQKWKRVHTILSCISELFLRYNASETHTANHSKFSELINGITEYVPSSVLCAKMRENEDLLAYNALNIPSALCQSNAQVAFMYLTFKYMNQRGYQGVGDVPEEDGWQIHIYFGEEELRILHRKQCRKYRDKKGKHEVEFVIDWEMDSIYNLNADKCLSVELRTVGFSYLNPRLKNKRTQQINTDLYNGHHIVYQYDSSKHTSMPSL